MPLRNNPFQLLYFTESISDEEYTKLFSPVLINEALAIFQPGTIVLEGVQGSGKSMLLALLKPEIRFAYLKDDIPFPVPQEFSRFLGAGINLLRSGAIDFGARMAKDFTELQCKHLVTLFGDFVNFWIIDDILQGLDIYGANQTLASELQIDCSKNALKRFVNHVKSKECWFDSLRGATDYSSLRSTIKKRINEYRRFLRGHSTINESISNTSTIAGEPISQVIRSARESGVIPNDLHVFIRVDQCEEMVRLEAKAEEHDLHIQFREVVNKMLGTRDSNVSYRLAGRRYAFRTSGETRMHGTIASLEDMRNFAVVNLDEILRRRENRKNWIFPKFANDVFRRRLKWSGYKFDDVEKELISVVLGGSLMSIKEKVKCYTKNSTRFVLQMDDEWPLSIRQTLLNLLESDPLSAKLGEAWVRQQIKNKKEASLEYLHEDDYPWERESKKWWKKERLFLASLQIAAAQGQKLIWARKDDVINLSGSNILVFVTLFQHIWQAWLRSQPLSADWSDASLPCIESHYIQSEGIEEASDRWYDKLREETEGDSRRRFVSLLGILFRNGLRADKDMSYPGHNGISLSLNDLESDSGVYSILQDASVYGAMVDMKHTPKTKSRGESRKWYLHPVLAPHFQVPAMHTKEPMYVDVRRVRKWLEKAQVIFPRETSPAEEADE